MRVLAINGSPHSDGSTYNAIKLVTNQLEAEGISSEVLHIGTKPISGCLACGFCSKQAEPKCAINGDSVNEAMAKAKEADGIIIASPVHFSGIAGTMKCFLDRFFYAGVSNLWYKVGFALCAVRRSGGVTTFDQLNHYLAYGNMAIAGGQYWPVIHGLKDDEVLQDAEGVQNLKRAGSNMAWLIKNLQDTTPPAFNEQRIFTNFIS